MDPAAIACSTGGDGAIQDAIKKLNKIYISSKKTGKENACGKESVATAQQCLKAAQAQLPKPGSNVEHLATLCQSSIRVMEQDRSKEGLRRAQHAAYSTIRQLVSAKAFGAAMEEALRLHGQLQKQRAAESLVPEALNLAVGTLITLALCWAEGAPTSSDQLASILHAAETSEQLFRQLKPEEAAKHSQTLFKSLYKGAANLLKGQQWQTLTATCSCMVSAGGLGNVAQSMQAVAKLAGHIPEAKAVGLLSAIISTELIGTSLEDALLSSTRGRDPETACLEVLAAAAGPASALRKASAKLAAAHAQPVDLLGAFGGPEAALKIADALEKAAAVIAVGYRLAPENSAFASQAHASAVAVATAAKLQGAACCLGHSGAMSVGACVAAVLGWEWPAWRSVPSVLSTTELSWLASSLHNIGVDLLSNCMPEDATECFKGAVAASFTVLGQLQAEGGTSLVNSVATVQVADINKRLTAFTEALLKAGKDAEAAQAAEDGLALVVYLCGQDLAAYGAQVHAAVASAVEVRCRALPPTSAAPKASSKRSGAAAAKSRARSKGGQAPSSFTGVLANHAVAVPSTSIALVAQAELAASASLLRSGGTPEWCNAAQKVAAAVVEDLLGSVYPAQAAPLEHARLLLLLHTLQLPGSSEGALDRTETAIASIRGKKHGDVQLFGALVAATRVLDGAQALVSAALERQQQAHMARQARLKHNPSEVHAEAAEIGSDDGSSAEVDAAGWEGVLEETAALVDNLSALVDLGVIGREESSTADAAALASAVRGIATLAGMHGRMALEQRLASGAGGLQHPEQWDVPSTVPALEYCLLPSALHGNSEAMPTPTMLQKAEAAMSHALVHASHGDIVSALRHAGEAQRLLAPALRSDPLAKASSADSQGADGFWRLAAAYCKGLLLLARLFEGAGMADEAAHAAKEGQRMAATLGCSLLVAAFDLTVGQIAFNSGQSALATASFEAAASHLTAFEGSEDAVPAVQYCQAMAHDLQARVHLASGSLTPAMLSCHAALELCGELQISGGRTPPEAVSPVVGSLHASAMLARVQILKAEARSAGEIADAARSSLQDLESVSIGAFGAAQRAQLALLLADALAPPRMEQNPQMARVWCPGQFAKEIEAHDIAAAPASKSSKSRTGMSKATTAHTKGSSRDAATRWAAQQELWQAFLEGRCCPHVQRHAAALLAPACAAAGHLYLAAALLQGSMGATLQLQHRLVLHTRVVQTGKRRGQSHGGNGVEGETDSQALALLEGPWDWDAIEALAGKGRTRAPAECLEALDGQAASALDSWLGALPYGTAVCSLSSAGTSPCGDHVVLTRLQPGRQPLILELPVKSFSEASLANHPIRALNLDPDAPSGAATNSGLPKGAVASVAAEMQRLLERSTQSMKDLKTDTKEQQREWWRARVELDDAVASLVQHLDSEWLGPWRCMLVGAPEGGAGVAEQLDACAARAVRELASALGSVEADNGCSSVVEGLVAVILFGKSGMSPAELRSASAAVCAALGAATTAGNVAYVAKTLAELKLELADIGRGVAPSCTAVTEEQEAPVGVARRVTFQTSPPPQKLVGEKAPASPITGARLRPAFSAAAAESSRRSVRAVSPSDLCGAFDALAVGGGNAEDAGLVAQTPGPTTVRAKKHRSRLGGMQAATPAAPRTAKRPGGGLAVAFDAPPTVSRTAATAPRPRRPQATPMTTVRTVPAAPRPKPSASGPSGAPVVLVLDATLQALPWESIPGLAQQRLYRLPSLPCAAAALVASQHCTSPTGSADRADAECLNDVALAMPRVDTSSVYYAINPSGDLMDTQATFEDWFRGLAGWEGRAGSPPPTAELATALQSKGLFVYCGHGGAEQYLSSARLRALPRCAPALLMGCSSGRLRKRAGYYEPSGVVLAYLLAGCPAAVANLWDVTDKDIDRYCQAVLTQWLSSGGVEKRDVAAAVGSARMACKLPFLIGAAPVCYGVPTAVAPIEKTKK